MRFDDGPIEAFGHFVREIVAHRSHIRTIFAQEFRNSYSGTHLGVFWNFALPLLPVSVYVLLASLRVLPNFEGVPGGLFVALGVTVWFFFAGCVQQPISVVQSRNIEAMKTSLPLSASVISGFARLVFETLVRLGLVLAFTITTKTVPASTAPLALGIFVIGAVFFLSIGLMAALMNIVWPDVQRLVNVFLQYGIFLSGVIFPLSALGPLSFLDWINPFAVFIRGFRELVYAGTLTEPLTLVTFSALALLLMLVAVRTFYIMEQRIRGVA